MERFNPLLFLTARKTAAAQPVPQVSPAAKPASPMPEPVSAQPVEAPAPESGETTVKTAGLWESASRMADGDMSQITGAGTSPRGGAKPMTTKMRTSKEGFFESVRRQVTPAPKKKEAGMAGPMMGWHEATSPGFASVAPPTPQMLDMFRTNTGTRYNPASRMDQENMRRLRDAQPTLDLRGWRAMQAAPATPPPAQPAAPPAPPPAAPPPAPAQPAATPATQPVAGTAASTTPTSAPNTMEGMRERASQPVPMYQPPAPRQPYVRPEDRPVATRSDGYRPRSDAEWRAIRDANEQALWGRIQNAHDSRPAAYQPHEIQLMQSGWMPQPGPSPEELQQLRLLSSGMYGARSQREAMKRLQQMLSGVYGKDYAQFAQGALSGN